MLSFDPLFVPGVTRYKCHVSRTIRDHVTPPLSLDIRLHASDLDLDDQLQDAEAGVRGDISEDDDLLQQ